MNLKKSEQNCLTAEIKIIVPSLKGKFTQKASSSEMKEPTKTTRAPLTICEYLFWVSRYFILKFQICLYGRRHDSHFLNGIEAQMTLQLQY